MTARRSNKRPLREHLAREATHLQDTAETLPAGAERDNLLRKARGSK